MPPVSGGIFDYDAKSARLVEVSQILEDASIWNDAPRAQELGRELRSLEGVVVSLNNIALNLNDTKDLFEMAREENDEETLNAVSADIDGIEKHVAAMEFRRMFNNPLDPNPCFIEIQSGAGGTEAQDWA